MDFLDPKKQKAHAIRLWIGYALIGIALLLGAVILVYQAYGYSIDRHGRIIQNGLVFVSSQPTGATIYTNTERQSNTTNTRLALPAGQYVFELQREGYHTWKRAITVEGGSVQRFDYPFLFPADVRTEAVAQYEAQPSAVLHSPDRRWLLVQTGPDNFDLFDLSSEEPAAQPFTVPAEVLSTGTRTTGWEQIEWARDNRRAVVKRSFEKDGQAGSEYILLDREEPAQSQNLTQLLGFNPTTIQLRDREYDQYYAFDQNSGILFTASVEEPTPQPYLEDVLDFAADGSDTVLYVTDRDAPEGKALVRIRQGDERHTIRETAREAPYLLGLARYNGAWLAAAGAQRENRVYVYRNPIDSLKSSEVAVPIQILKVDKPDHVAFSTNGRFVMTERADSFAVYDAETDRGYAYELDIPVDGPRAGATWMDGFRMTLISKGQVVVFDFDGTNQHSLMPASPNHIPAFNPDYTLLYTVSPENALTTGNLRTPADE